MRILICGDRDWSDRAAIDQVLLDLKPTLVIEGDARGADRMAGEAADALGIEKLVFPANWDKYKRAAGPIRNQQMLDEGHPDLVIAFHDNLAESKGTRDMVRRSMKAGLAVLLYAHADGLQAVESKI